MTDPITRAREHLAAERFAEALAILAAVPPGHPRWGEAQVERVAIHRRRGERATAAEVLRGFLARHPRHLNARLALADTLAGIEPDQAFALFNAAAEELLADSARLPAHLDRFREAPVAAIAHLRRRLVDLVVDEADGPDKTRFLEFVASVFDSERAAALRETPMHRPGLLFYPGIAQQPWYPAESVEFRRCPDFPRLREEVLALLANRSTRPYFQSAVPTPEALEALRNNADWSVVVVREPGAWRVSAEEAPALRGYLDGLPLAECPAHAPEVILSILRPGTHIPAHHGLSNFKLAHHLPIVVPEGDLGIRVGNAVERWREGEPIFFDDSFEHEAWNRGDSIRVVLIADVWHPDLGARERDWLAATIRVLDGWLGKPVNRLFQYRLHYPD